MHDRLATLYPAHLATVQHHAEQALARGGFDHLLIAAGMPGVKFLDDNHYPYAVSPPFKHWLPLTDAPGSWVAYTPGRKPKLIFLQPRDYWHVVPDAPAGYWVDGFEIVVVRTAEEAVAELPRGRCASIGEANAAVAGIEFNNPPAVLDYLHYHRAYKTPYELELMRAASRIGTRAHRAAESAFRAGASEFDIHMAYCSAARQDANELPYGNIIALNRHGAVLHYMDFDRAPPAQLRSFLIDAGASHAGYACDITRTYSADPGDEFQALVNAVDLAQQRMCAQVRAGFDYRQLHLDAHMALATILRDFGVITVSPEAAVATGVSSAFFPHGVGHGIGLQVHEVAGFAESDAGGSIPRPEGHPYLRLTRALAPGMVVTIEPGIYFIDMLLDELRAGPYAASVDWSRVDAFRPFGGIRIEDDVVCTDGAPINLTREGFADAA